MLLKSVVALVFLLVSAAPSETARPGVGMRAGQVHPEVELPGLDGRVVKLSDYAGQRLVVTHFASW